ncbi:MAG: hypothetical protein IT440_06365 [Phycisphaeraceae bacterium]|nr:hypothetical protein [Phycisphaeraceae bacterium]
MQVRLTSVDQTDSDVAVCSLPMPPFHADVTVSGATVTQAVPLGQWPARALLHPALAAMWKDAKIAAPDPLGNPPRRCLVYARFPGCAPDAMDVTLTPSSGAPARNDATFPVTLKLQHDEEIYHHRDEKLYHYVKREDSVRVEGHGAGLTLRLAWRIGDELRYWQWVQMIPAWQGELTQAFTLGGHLYAGPVDRMMTMEESKCSEQTPFYDEATIAARAFVVLHADGRIELTVHYANTEAYGNGCAVRGLPVVEWTFDQPATSQAMTLDEGDAEMSDAGRTWRWSFLQNSRIYLGHRTNPITGDIQVDEAEGSDTSWLEGVARSVAGVISLTGKASPPRRMLAPAAWYLRCAEWGTAMPQPHRDKHPALADLSDAAVDVFLRNTHEEGMCRGGVYRYLDDLTGRHELSMDGNEATQLFRGSYLRSHGELYRTATRAARFIADVAIDHNQFNVHYHGDSPAWHTYSMIYLRFGGLVTLWQETGDPWYLERAESVGNRWISLNRVNHPRQNMGRDAEPVEGICQLYDATGKDHYFVEAEKIALDVARSLFADGSWRCGHGVGPFWGINALQGSPWNGSHLLAGVAEFLVRASPRTTPHYAHLLQSACSLVRELLRKVRDDCQGYHRATGSFLPRRHFMVAHLAQDAELLRQVQEAIDRLGLEYAKAGAAFYKTGHHCAGYLDSPAVYLGLA